MSVTPKALYTGGQLASSAALLYASPANTTTIVTAATFTNTDTGAHTLTAYIVRSGGTAGAANEIIPGITLSPAPALPYVSPELAGQVLGPGDAIWAKADTGAVVTCAGISGLQVYNA